MKTERCPVAIRQHIEPCGCVVTERPGHVHTKMCESHVLEFFNNIRFLFEPKNLDLIGL